MKHSLIIVLACLCFSFSAFSRSGDSVSFYSSAKKLDLGKLWHSDSIVVFDHESLAPDTLICCKKAKEKFPQPLGFRGDNYRRFYTLHI